MLINILGSGACPGLDPGFTGVTRLYEIISPTPKKDDPKMKFQKKRRAEPMKEREK
jgi:hypothetical protein